MKNPPRNIYYVQVKSRIKAFPMKKLSFNLALDSLQQQVHSLKIYISFHKAFSLVDKIRMLGVTDFLEDYESRKLKVFNLLNFFQLIFGIAIPVSAAISNHRISVLGWIAACMPPMVSLLVLFLNSRR